MFFACLRSVRLSYDVREVRCNKCISDLGYFQFRLGLSGSYPFVSRGRSVHTHTRMHRHTHVVLKKIWIIIYMSFVFCFKISREHFPILRNILWKMYQMHWGKKKYSFFFNMKLQVFFFYVFYFFLYFGCIGSSLRAFFSCGSRALEHRLSSCGAWA